MWVPVREGEITARFPSGHEAAVPRPGQGTKGILTTTKLPASYSPRLPTRCVFKCARTYTTHSPRPRPSSHRARPSRRRPCQLTRVRGHAAIYLSLRGGAKGAGGAGGSGSIAMRSLGVCPGAVTWSRSSHGISGHQCPHADSPVLPDCPSGLSQSHSHRQRREVWVSGPCGCSDLRLLGIRRFPA